MCEFYVSDSRFDAMKIIIYFQHWHGRDGYDIINKNKLSWSYHGEIIGSHALAYVLSREVQDLESLIAIEEFKIWLYV
jgi:hypothetical protein